jgi:hypothetical protein
LKISGSAAKLVGAMLLVQVILGGGSTLLRFPAAYHLIWGALTFAALLAVTFLLVREHGIGSTVFRLAAAAILDFVIQGLLGLASFGSAVAIVVHLANAFVLIILTTWLIIMVSSTGGSPPEP